MLGSWIGFHHNSTIQKSRWAGNLPASFMKVSSIDSCTAFASSWTCTGLPASPWKWGKKGICVGQYWVGGSCFGIGGEQAESGTLDREWEDGLGPSSYARSISGQYKENSICYIGQTLSFEVPVLV